MIPLIQATTEETTGTIYEADLDLSVPRVRDLPADANWTPESFSTQMLEIILDVASRRYTPKPLWEGKHRFPIYAGIARHLDVKRRAHLKSKHETRVSRSEELR